MIGLKLLDPSCWTAAGSKMIFDPSSWPGMFFLQVVAVVIGGLLLLLVVKVLRFAWTPLKWWRRNRALRELIRRRKEFLLVYQPQSGASKTIILLDGGQIADGRNNNEHTWRVKRGCLEFLADDRKVFSRFKLDQARGRLGSTADPDVRSLFGQYLLPQYQERAAQSDSSGCA